MASTDTSLVRPAKSASADSVTRQSRPFLAGWMGTIILMSLWCLLVVSTGLHSPDFIKLQAVSAVAFNMAFVGVLVVGVGFVMLSGGEFDLSVGVTCVAAALITAKALVIDIPWPIAVGGALVFGAIVGIINGLLVVRMGIHPVVATLGSMFLVSGITRLIVDFVPIPRDSFIRQHLAGNFLFVPRVFWVMLLILVGAAVIIGQTKLGRHIIAVGGNYVAAVNRGISGPRVRWGAFVACGLLAGVAGVLLASQGDIVQSTLTPGTEFRVISILLLGGMALKGGVGNFVGVGAALLLLSTLPTAIVTWGISSAWQPVVEGIVLAIALAVNAKRSRS